MLYKVFDFADTEVREVMAPRPNIAALSVDTPLKECLSVAIDSPYTRHPVYRGTLDDVIGVLHIRDIFAAHHRGQLDSTTLRDLLRPVPFIPETKNLGVLLGEFRRTHQQIAIVLDEYGATQGLVTLEDLLEEIVGEIADEYDLLTNRSDGSAPGQRRSPGHFRSTTSATNSASRSRKNHSTPSPAWSSTGSVERPKSATKYGSTASASASSPGTPRLARAVRRAEHATTRRAAPADRASLTARSAPAGAWTGQSAHAPRTRSGRADAAAARANRASRPRGSRPPPT